MYLLLLWIGLRLFQGREVPFNSVLRFKMPFIRAILELVVANSALDNDVFFPSVTILTIHMTHDLKCRITVGQNNKFSLFFYSGNCKLRIWFCTRFLAGICSLPEFK